LVISVAIFRSFACFVLYGWVPRRKTETASAGVGVCVKRYGLVEWNQIYDRFRCCRVGVCLDAVFSRI